MKSESYISTVLMKLLLVMKTNLANCKLYRRDIFAKYEQPRPNTTVEQKKLVEQKKFAFYS